MIAAAEFTGRNISSLIQEKTLVSLEDAQMLIDTYRPKKNVFEDEIKRLEINARVYSAIESFIQAII